MSNKPALALLLTGALVSGPALAVPLLAGSGFPAPGGTSTSSVGSSINVGGRTITYTGFNPSAYTDLYYAVGDYSPTFNVSGPRLQMDTSPPDVLSFNSGLSNLASGIVVWTGTTNYFTHNIGTTLTHTRFTLKITDTAGNPLGLISPTSLGLSAALGGVLDVNADFKANWSFEADGPSASDVMRAASSMFNDGSLYNRNTALSPSLQASVGGAFYYTAPSTVPEPSALLLAGLGLLGFAVRRRKHVT